MGNGIEGIFYIFGAIGVSLIFFTIFIYGFGWWINARKKPITRGAIDNDDAEYPPTDTVVY